MESKARWTINRHVTPTHDEDGEEVVWRRSRWCADIRRSGAGASRRRAAPGSELAKREESKY
ncbi:hypothetical protein E2562_016771 [Oryza meyeriana var. granulata]|uniref:Uncharacterized protein n=1 Tax=Oryza meyeriana var. granulata TaxID=110450 RepID=A0A6G1BWU3_9ORYZ|nr:hypothetical protein E2562_016771 [Oryza meyeriana var. granulata]